MILHVVHVIILSYFVTLTDRIIWLILEYYVLVFCLPFVLLIYNYIPLWATISHSCAHHFVCSVLFYSCFDNYMLLRVTRAQRIGHSPASSIASSHLILSHLTFFIPISPTLPRFYRLTSSCLRDIKRGKCYADRKEELKAIGYNFIINGAVSRTSKISSLGVVEESAPLQGKWGHSVLPLSLMCVYLWLSFRNCCNCLIVCIICLPVSPLSLSVSLPPSIFPSLSPSLPPFIPSSLTTPSPTQVAAPGRNTISCASRLLLRVTNGSTETSWFKRNTLCLSMTRPGRGKHGASSWAHTLSW